MEKETKDKVIKGIVIGTEETVVIEDAYRVGECLSRFVTVTIESVYGD